MIGQAKARDISNMRQTPQRVVMRSNSYNQTQTSFSQDRNSIREGDERLSFKDIQNITKSMIKQKRVHGSNLGVIHNIKGKMYCLKLG